MPEPPNGKVSLFGAWLMAQIRPFILACVPAAFAGMDFVESIINVLSVAHIVEYEELRFRTEIARIGSAGAPEVGLGFLRNVADVATIGLTGNRVSDVADQDQRRCRGKRIEESSHRIRDDKHVTFLNLLEAPD